MKEKNSALPSILRKTEHNLAKKVTKVILNENREEWNNCQWGKKKMVLLWGESNVTTVDWYSFILNPTLVT